MPNKTDLNVTPYYDDFDKSKNFQQILARPAYAVQARELTQMQSILKNQVENLGNFSLAEGSMVIPGQLFPLVPFRGIKLETISYFNILVLNLQLKNQQKYLPKQLYLLFLSFPLLLNHTMP